VIRFGKKLWIEMLQKHSYPQFGLVFKSCSSKRDSKKPSPRTAFKAGQALVKAQQNRLVHRKHGLLLLPLLNDIRT
jgi:hypothetical protein